MSRKKTMNRAFHIRTTQDLRHKVGKANDRIEDLMYMLKLCAEAPKGFPIIKIKNDPWWVRLRNRIFSKGGKTSN